MKKAYLLLILLSTTLVANAQINMKDSTVQAIVYWDKMEKQTYKVSEEKIKLEGSDTISKSIYSYKVEITVLDSTANSYTAEWVYKDFTGVSSTNFNQNLSAIMKDVKVVFKTNELGEFMEVVNWEEIRDKNKKAIALLENKFKDLNESQEVLLNIRKSYTTKAAVESSCIKDIRQLLTFNGAQYKLGEVIDATVETQNSFGGKPFDVHTSLYLEEINEEENNYILRASQEVDSQQLTEETYKFVISTNEKFKKDHPTIENFPKLKNEILTDARIHSSGWIIYSRQTITVITDEDTNIDERIIEIE